METIQSHKSKIDPSKIVKKIKELQKDDTLSFREILKKAFSEVKTTDFVEYPQVEYFTIDTLIEFYDNLKKVNDFVEDIAITRQGKKNEIDKAFRQLEQNQFGSKQELKQLKEQLQLLPEEQQDPFKRGFTEYPMTPVASSFIKGAGAYKGMLLLEFHHSPGSIWGFDVKGQGAEFFRELMNSGSKGGWVWDKILGKPSVYGMAKGKFYSYNQKGTQNFFTSNGAQFVHLYGRPVKFSYNPVGYSNNEMAYQKQSDQWKKWKEKLVEPFWSRNAIKISKLKAVQEKEYKNKVDLIYLGNLTEDSLEQCLEYYKKEGKSEEESNKICFSAFHKNKEKKVEKKTEHISGTKEMSIEGKEYLKKAFRHIPNHLLEDIHIYIYESFENLESHKDSIGYYSAMDKSLNISKKALNEQILPFDALQSVLTHELGHYVWDLIRYDYDNFRVRNEIENLYYELKPQLEKDYIYYNQYAAKNSNEFFAELFSRYFNVQKNQELAYQWKYTKQKYPRLQILEDILRTIKNGGYV